jgi:hypothetical protein
MSGSITGNSIQEIQKRAQENTLEMQERMTELEREAALQAWSKKCEEIAMAGYKKDSKLADMSAPAT